MADAYLRQRQINHDISGTLVVTAATDDTTLATAKTAHTIFVQRVVFFVTTDAAQSISFEDSAGSPIRICKIPTSPGVDTRWDFDFTSKGIALTEAKNFVMNVSAAGLAGQLVWEGYMKQTAVFSA